MKKIGENSSCMKQLQNDFLNGDGRGGVAEKDREID